MMTDTTTKMNIKLIFSVLLISDLYRHLYIYQLYWQLFNLQYSLALTFDHVKIILIERVDWISGFHTARC